MKVDAFLLASGMIGNFEIGAEAAEALRDVAYEFLSAGGHVSLAEFGELSESSRAALIGAGKRIAHEETEALASRLADLLTDQLSEAAEEAGSDGAKAAAKLLVDSVVGAPA